MAAVPSRQIPTRQRWLATGAVPVALGFALTLLGFIIGMAAPRVACEPGLPTSQLTFGDNILSVGALLQLVPVIIALIARRRWRTSLVLSVILLVYGVATLVGDLWPSLKPVFPGNPAAGILLGLGALTFGIWLYKVAQERHAPLPLTARDANLLIAGGVLVFAAALGGGTILGFRHFCIYW